jgi:acetate kinase
MAENSILVLNPGSSSLKLGLYSKQGADEALELDGLADGIGKRIGKLVLKNSRGEILRTEESVISSEEDALEQLGGWINECSSTRTHAIGIRVVHGGPRLMAHQWITPKVLGELRNSVHYAPLHLPTALRLIDRCARIYPDVRPFACFDTAFHATLPETAARFALPDALFEEGIRRYGFHGLSYESIVHQLGENLPSRTVVAHLGSGASLAALKDGRSVDTTMGLTPTGGIPMSTRSGDLDPGVLLYLLRVKRMNTDSLEEMLNHRSGLLALSKGQSDMRELQTAALEGDSRAERTIEIFCTAVSKEVAAYAAVLGGLDLLVFTGGIGENSEPVRNKVRERLRFLDIRDAVIPSQEDLQIARHCLKAIENAPTQTAVSTLQRS